MRYIGIVVAMDEEREEILNLMKDTYIEQKYNLRFIIGNLNNRQCILVKSGVGKVNSARTTQALIENYELDFVIKILMLLIFIKHMIF